MNSLECLNKSSIKLLQRNNLLIPLIKSEIKREKVSSVDIDIETKKKAISELLTSLGLNDQETFDTWKRKSGLKDIEIENLAFDKYKLNKYCKLHFENKAEARFLERKSDLDIVIYSLIRIKEYTHAREIFLRIEDNEKEFGDLATQYSEGLEKTTRGIIGPVPIGSAHPQLAEILKHSPPGEVQPPIKIEGLYLVVRVESYDPAQLDNFMRGKMCEELFNNWLTSKALEVSQTLLNSNPAINENTK